MAAFSGNRHAPLGAEGLRLSGRLGLSPHTPLFSRLAGGGNPRFPPLAPVDPPANAALRGRIAKR